MLGSLFGALGAASKRRAAEEAARIAREIKDQLLAAGYVANDAMIIDIASIPNVERWNPATFDAVMQQPSLLANFRRDEGTQQVLQETMDRLGELSVSGLSGADRGMFQEAQMQAAMQERASREAAVMDAQARSGQAGAQGFAASLLAGQAGANRMATDSREIARIAQQRALEAMAARANLGSGMLDRDFSQAQGIASAQDAVNARNANATDLASKSNTDAANAALNLQGTLADSAASRYVQAMQANQGFGINRDAQTTNRFAVAGNIANQEGAAVQARGQATADMYGAIGSGALGADDLVGKHLTPKPGM